MEVDVYTLHARILPLLQRFEGARTTAAEGRRRSRSIQQTMAAAFVPFSVLALIGSLVVAGVYGADFVFGSLGVLADELRALRPPGFLIVVAIALAWFGHYLLTGTRREVLDTRRSSAVVRVLRMLRADTPQLERVRLTVDFRDCEDGGRVESQRHLLDTPIFEPGLEKRIVHTWFELCGKLADRSRYRIRATDRVTRRQKKKGREFSIKDRVASGLSLRLRLHPERYGDLEPILARLKRQPSPRRLVLERIAANGRTLDVRFASRGRALRRCSRPHGLAISRNTVVEGLQHGHRLVSADDLLAAFLWVYDGLAVTRSREARA